MTEESGRVVKEGAADTAVRRVGSVFQPPRAVPLVFDTEETDAAKPALFSQRGHQGVVRIEEQEGVRPASRKFRYAAAHLAAEALQLPVPIELVAEEVRYDHQPRLQPFQRRRQGGLVHLEEADVATGTAAQVRTLRESGGDA